MTAQSIQPGSIDLDHVPRWNDRQGAALDEAIARVMDDVPTVLLVQGGPGTGKTTFLRQVAAAARGFHLLYLHADRDWQQPYAALAEWGVLESPADPGLTSLQAARMLRSRIEQIRCGATVLVVIDDMQALDAGSSDAIARLVERTFCDRLLVAVAVDDLARPALAPWNRLVLDADRTIHLELTGLDEHSAAELIAHAWPDVDTSLCRRLWEHTAGNPLFLQTILQQYHPDEVLDADELPVPRDLARTLTSHLQRLDTDDAVLLRAAVVLGDRWASSLTVGILAGLDDPTDAVDRLRRGGLLVSRGACDHPEIRVASGVLRTVIAAAIPAGERRDLHRRAASLVDSPIEALRHRYRAAGGYDDDLAAELDAAAWSLHLTRHFQQAYRVGLWASAVTADPAGRERRLLNALFDAALARDFDTVEHRLACIGCAHDEALRNLIEGFLLIGRRRWLRAAAVLLAVPDALIAATDPRTQRRLRVLRAWTLVVTGGSAERARRELALTRAAPSTEPRLNWYFIFAAAMAEDSSARTATAHKLDLYNAWRGASAAVAGLPDLAVRALHPFTARFDDGLLIMCDGEFHALQGYAYWLRGNWHEARKQIRTGLESRYGTLNPMLRAVTVLADLAAGDPGTLAEHRAETRAALREAPWPHAIAVAATAEFLCLRLTGRHREQARYLDGLNADFGTITWPGAEPALWLLTLGMINAAARRPQAVHDLANRLADAEADVAWREAGVAWLRGLAAALDGDLQHAAGQLEHACALGMTTLPVHASVLASDLARIRRAMGDDTGADTAQRESDNLLARIDGARYLITTADPLAPLSDREREVVALLTQGLSYAQIAEELHVSRSTVRFHLINVYAKTATTSRHQLTELVRRS